MSPGRKTAIAAGLTILLIGSVFGAYYLNTSAALASQGQTISALQSTVSSLVSHPATSTTTSSVTYTESRFPYVPWDTSKYFVAYVKNSSDGCSGGPCLTMNLREAFLFTCVKEAASQQGCTVQINSTNPLVYSQITLRYPYIFQSNDSASSWANCAISSPVDHPDNRIPTYCLPIGSRGFVVTWQLSPPG